VKALNTAVRLVRHPAAILALMVAEAGLAYLTGLASEPAAKALAAAAFAAIAAGIVLLMRTMKPRHHVGAHAARTRPGRQWLPRRQRP
jgi:hypothetical protein